MEATTLRQAGYEVAVICPRGRYRQLHEVLENIHIYRYPLPSLSGLVGHLLEYGVALPASLLLSVLVWFRHGFDVIHAANPPDFFFVVAALFKPLGTKFVFDQHDLVPETTKTRWRGRGSRPLLVLSSLMERATFRMADIVIATNESYRQIAVGRGGVPAERVFVVRSAPRKHLFKAGPPRPELREGRQFLVVYLGVMGPNDGLEYLLEAIAHVTRKRAHQNVLFVLIGDGDMRPGLVQKAKQMGICDWVKFTGRLPDEQVVEYLSTADLAVAPDPKDPLNDVSTMNKIVEYMAIGKPMVTFDLREARISAGRSALYASCNDTGAFGEAVLDLLSRPALRRYMGRLGRRRFEAELAWDCQEARLLAAYDSLLKNMKREMAWTIAKKTGGED
jgi:glycosyltransferase involved in cell wall biosynthesis